MDPLTKIKSKQNKQTKLPKYVKLTLLSSVYNLFCFVLGLALGSGLHSS